MADVASRPGDPVRSAATTRESGIVELPGARLDDHSSIRSHRRWAPPIPLHGGRDEVRSRSEACRDLAEDATRDRCRPKQFVCEHDFAGPPGRDRQNFGVGSGA
jgi:hypothetical protein